MKFIRARELLRRNKGEIQWVMKPFAVKGSVLMLYGRQGLGKSRLLWQLSYALATGTDWLGFQVQRPGKVAYVSLDMPEGEAEKMLIDAEQCGLGHDDIYFPASQELNLLKRHELEGFAEGLMEADATHIVLDTGERSFTPVRGANINDEVRAVIKAYQTCVPQGMAAYSHHNRKRPGRQTEEDFETDADSFTGAVQWEGSATSSIKLTQRNRQLRLYFMKNRLAKPNMISLLLSQDEESGFFRAHHDYQSALIRWPTLVPEQERFIPKQAIEVFRDVAARYEVKTDTVKAQFHRMRKNKIHFDWYDELLSRNGDGVTGDNGGVGDVTRSNPDSTTSYEELHR
jgi:hypothetical protein